MNIQAVLDQLQAIVNEGDGHLPCKIHIRNAAAILDENHQLKDLDDLYITDVTRGASECNIFVDDGY